MCYLGNHDLVVALFAVDVSSVEECDAFVESMFEYGGSGFMGEGSIEYA